MKIIPKIFTLGKTIGIASVVILPFVSKPACANESNDCFVKSTTTTQNNNELLSNAPNPSVTIMGEIVNAVIVVDLENNKLYKYDEYGKATEVFPIASGRPGHSTKKGVRIVSHFEKYPYVTAGRHTKRRRNPRAFGPKIILLKMLDPETGETQDNGEYIHGTNDPSSIGKKVSHGCVRLQNDDILHLATLVKRGDIIVFK